MAKIKGKLTWTIRGYNCVGFGNQKQSKSRGNGDIISTGDRNCQADLKPPEPAVLGLRAGHFTKTINWEYPEENKECPFEDGNSFRIREITLGIFSAGWVTYNFNVPIESHILFNFSIGAAYTDGSIYITNTRH